MADLFKHSSFGWLVERTTTTTPTKVRAKVERLTVWAERDEEGKWWITQVQYLPEGARHGLDVLPLGERVEVKSHISYHPKLKQALSTYWTRWRDSPEGVLERVRDLEKKAAANG